MTGWALLFEGRLVDCGHVARQALIAWELSKAQARAGQKLPPDPSQVTGGTLVAEKPTYRGRTPGENKATPEDLITLAITLGETVGLYRRKVGVVEFVTPQEWKGSVPKEVSHNRAQKVLDPSEIWPSNHNARDAVAIGLWKVGRYRR